MLPSATELRARLYASLDQVALLGEDIELERKGVNIRISRDIPSPRLENLPVRDTMVCEPEVLVSQGWADEWKVDP